MFEWFSKEIHVRKPINLGAGVVCADFFSTPEEQAAITAENAARSARNTALLAEINSVEVWGVDDTPASTEFLDKTAGFDDATDANFSPFNFTAAEASGDYIAIGYAKPFTKVVFDYANGTAGVGAGLSTVWEYWDGSAWTALSGVTDGTSAFTTAVADSLSVTFTEPLDWATTTIDTSAALYFIRLRISAGDYSTNPVLDQGHMFRRPVLRGPFGSRSLGSQALADTILEPLLDESNQFLQFTIYGGGVVRHMVTCDAECYFRIPGGWRSDKIMVQISGNVRMRSLELAETMRELQTV